MKDFTLEEQIAFVEKLRKRLEMSGYEADNLMRQGYRPTGIIYTSQNGEMYEAIKKSLEKLKK